MNEYSQARNADFVKRAKNILLKAQKNGYALSVTRLVDLTLSSCPTSFFQSYPRAVQMMHRYAAGKALKLKSRNAIEFWDDMYAQVLATMEKRSKLKFEQAVMHVIMFCRPRRYYLSHDYAVRLLRPYFDSAATLKAV